MLGAIVGSNIEAWATPEIRGGTAPSMRSEPDEAKQVCGAEIDAQAAEHGLIPDKMVIDDLRSYGTAANDLGISDRHETMAQQSGGELASDGVFGRLLAHLERQGCCASSPAA
jgi:hypothetical protein